MCIIIQWRYYMYSNSKVKSKDFSGMNVINYTMVINIF